MTTSGVEVPAIPDVLIEDAEIRNILLSLKQIAEIREGRRGDPKQRFITYYELLDYLQGNDKLTVTAVTGGHNHDTLYSVLSHNHDSVYAKIENVDGVYALVVHNHEGLYAALTHQHDSLYSSIDHHHDGRYSEPHHDHFQFEEIEARAYWQSIL